MKGKTDLPIDASFKNFFYKIPQNIWRIFSEQNIIWHGSAMILTYALVVTGFDWDYFVYFQGSSVRQFLFAGVIVGGLVPIFLPLILWTWGAIRKSSETLYIAFALGQATISGYLVSIFYKALTGRLHPVMNDPSFYDVSREFRFGFLEGGVFWGWPSSHTTIAFSMAFALIALYPGNWKIKYLALLYAFFIGLGVSMSIHWFSDFAAGALIGATVGFVTGLSFFIRKKFSKNLS